MDYDFKFDICNNPIAEFSMGHEAIGSWFNDELGANRQRISALLETVEQLMQRKLFEKELEGVDYLLRLGRDEVEVIARALEFEFDQELPDETELYDDQSRAACGLPDFREALLAWQTFVSQP